jgi:adenylate cyclase
MRIELRGHPSDPHAAWQRLGDTDYLNREAGGGTVEMRIEKDGAGCPTVLGEMAGVLGFSMSFVERVSSWVHERWFRQVRVYRRSPIASTRFELALERADSGVIPRILLDIEPSSRWTAPAVNARANTIRARWQAVLDALPAPGQPDPGLDLRVLGAEALDAFDRWEKQAPSPTVGAVRQLVLQARDSELRKLRSNRVADRFGLDRDQVLIDMLRGVRAGALEVYFSVRCSRCSGQVEAYKSLSNLADHATCPSCDIRFDTDLASTVEVLFAPHPSVVPRIDEHFCTLNPGGAPEIRGSFVLEAGERVEEEVEVAPGRWILGAGGEERDLVLEAGDSGADAVSWHHGVTGTEPVRAGAVRLAIENDGPQRERVILASTEPAAEPVPASKVAMLAEFRRDVGPAVLAPDVRISARSVAIVFTDLSGSTRMYEALGDARAYSIVRDHFGIVTECVERHGGMRIKTIGDAVMASFHTARQAVAAALEARTAFDGWIAGQDVEPAPKLNVGIHVGPALAVHSDVSGFDWFGRTVNLAARAQSVATDGALVFTREVYEAQGVRELVLELGVEDLDVDLQGIGLTHLHRIPRAP